MEKKGNRNLPLAKASTTDSKKDGVSSKPWPRGCRRRESAGGNVSTKSEVSRKPQPQRIKTLDKRPRPRGGGGYNSGTVARNETSGLEENQQVELGSVFLPGSKKQSLNHLLNFSFLPRERGQYTSEIGHHGNRMLGTKKHKYNKEHFLQANCQFIVNDSGNYKQYLNNPDALVDWNLVEQVNVQVSEFPTCPICLYPPIAAKMTRCGHIYCWSCLLHYLSLSDKPSRKCPICFDTIHKQELKSVIANPFNTFNTNATITFKLMKRPKGGLIAYPSDADIKDDNTIFNMSEKESKDVYSKLLLANKKDVISIINREHEELRRQLEADDAPEKCFVEQAMVLLKERKSTVFGNCVYQNKEINIDELTISESSEELDVNKKEDSCTVGKNLDSSGSQPSKFHYFYQASDGQHIYLHAINARMLEHTYGSLEFSPKTLTGKILEKEGGSMTEDLRKRLRCLQHLPVTCQFEVAEIHLKSPTVSKETLEYFHDQLDIRRKRRQKRAKEEKRREKRIEVEENRKMGKYQHPDLHLESNIQFPEFGNEPRLRTESESTLPSERSASPDLSSNLSTTPQEMNYSGPSFAKMLSSKKSAPSWPSLNPSSSPEPTKLINVTGSKMRSNKIAAPIDSEPEPEDYEPVPSFNRSFGDAIAQALQQAKTEEEKIPSRGKKKKSKQKILFSTNMGYSEK